MLSPQGEVIEFLPFGHDLEDLVTGWHMASPHTINNKYERMKNMLEQNL